MGRNSWAMHGFVWTFRENPPNPVFNRHISSLSIFQGLSGGIHHFFDTPTSNHNEPCCANLQLRCIDMYKSLWYMKYVYIHIYIYTYIIVFILHMWSSQRNLVYPPNKAAVSMVIIHCSDSLFKVVTLNPSFPLHYPPETTVVGDS